MLVTQTKDWDWIEIRSSVTAKFTKPEVDPHSSNQSNSNLISIFSLIPGLKDCLSFSISIKEKESGNVEPDSYARVRLKIESKIRLEFNQSKERKSISSLVNCFDWSNSNSKKFNTTSIKLISN